MSINGAQLKDKFDYQWGKFRRFLSARPLTGFWIGVALGFGLRHLTGLVGLL